MKLRHYETFYLLHPDLNDEQRETINNKLQDIIVSDDGQIIKVDPWPLKKLAYAVQKQTHGYYVVLEYGAKASTVSEVTRNLRLDEGVMKFITTKLSDKFDPARIAQAKETGSTAKEQAEGPGEEA